MDLELFSKIVGYLFFAFSVGYLVRITNKHRDDIWGAIIGEDKKLSLPELCALLWVILFPVLFFAEIFLGLKAGEHIWYSMDSIFLIIIGGNAYKRYSTSNTSK